MKFTKDDTKIIKGAAICLMLYHHLFAFPDRLPEGVSFVSLGSFAGTSLSIYIGWFGGICVPMFLFLSGYGIYISSEKSENVRAMTLKRVQGLYKQMWQVFFLSLPFSLWVNRLKGAALIPEAILNGLSLDCSFNEEWWFILPFAVLLLLFPAIKCFLDRKNANLYTELLVLLLYSAFYNYIVPGFFSAFSLSGFEKSLIWHRMSELLLVFPAFFLGCIFAKYGILDRIKKDCAGKPAWCVLSLLCMAALFYLRLYNYIYDFVNGAVLVMCLTILLPLRILRWPFKVLGKLAEESTFMWLTHTFFCYYWCQKLVYAPRYSLLIFAFLVALSYGAAKCIRFIWENVLPAQAEKTGGK